MAPPESATDRIDELHPAASALTTADLEPAPRYQGKVLDQGVMRSVLGRFATGIAVVTAGSADPHGSHPHGMTANAFSSLSLDPPLVLVCVDREALMHESILDSEAFAVSVLHAGQEKLARHFSNRNRPLGNAQFDGVDWVPGERTRSPLLVGSLAWLECGLATTYDGGDHTIFVGRVLDTAHSEDHDALLFFGGAYHRMATGTRW
jgi:flavin reductase (DIM6/NTAB) family NADH-FMN oxidoreductase RutF